MIDQEFLGKLEEIRSAYIEVLIGLDESASFQSLYQNFPEVRDELDRLVQVARSPRIENPFVAEFTVAFVGSSGHGKTSVLAELFPGLASNDWNWLQTNITDTTSQALVIRQSRTNDLKAEGVTVHSWDMAQITSLVNAASVENKRQNIEVRSMSEYVEIDGENASFEPSAIRDFKFSRKIRLRPFPRTYSLTTDEAADPKKRLALTTKEESKSVGTGAVLSIDGTDFNALQLRTVIKSVELRESFHRVRSLLHLSDGESVPLVFVDTPGLNTTGNIKDEILRNTLAKKNQQIIVELLRHDELDLIVHLVLCGKTSAFQELWGPVKAQCDEDELADVEDRLILAVNGTNIYFTNPDLKSSSQDPAVAEMVGNHFASTLDDNILKKMSEHGTFHPARICFVDNKKNVESGFGPYEAFYAQHRATMESWTRPGGIGFKTLEEKGLIQSFRENLQAICDPNDRGLGFLLRQIKILIQESGNRLLVRKYLNKSKLHRSIRDLRVLVDSNYDATGMLNSGTVREAVKACTVFLDLEDPRAIEKFIEEAVDPQIPQMVPIPMPANPSNDWVQDAYKKLAQHLFNTIISRSRPGKDIADIFKKYFGKILGRAMKQWGYQGSDIFAPTAERPNGGYLVRHALKLHARELMYQVAIRSPGSGAAADIFQDEDDHAQMGRLVKRLSEIEKLGESLCQQNGVAVP